METEIGSGNGRLERDGLGWDGYKSQRQSREMGSSEHRQMCWRGIA